MIKFYLSLILRPLPPTELIGDVLESRFSLLRRLKLFFSIDIKKNAKIKILHLIKHILINIMIIIYYPIILLFYLLKIRFLHINLWQVGSIIHHLDFLVKENKLKHNYKLVLFAPKILSINNYIPYIYKKEVKVFTNIFLYLISLPLIHSRLVSIDPWDSENVNANSKCHQIHREYFKKYKTYICDLSEIDETIYKNFINKHNIDKKIISLHVRDDGFYGFKSNRSCEIDTYKKTISNLLKKNFIVIRFVNESSKKLYFDNKNYLELTTRNEEEKILQYLIIKNSFLCICTLGGPMSFNFITDTPFLITNLIPLSISGATKYKDQYIIKKYYSNNEKRFLNLKEIFEKKLYLYPNLCHKLNIQIIDNTEEEIFLATNQIINEIFNNNFFPNQYQQIFLKDLKDRYSICFSDAHVSKTFKL
jgi:putative glycosyltransferase (TIGR04372 family)